MTKQPFAVFDIDGTLIRWQLYHAVVNRLAKEGALGASAQDKLKNAMMAWKRRESTEAFKTYERLLITMYEEALQHIDLTLFDQLVGQVIEEYKDQTYLYTRQLISDLKRKDYLLLIISGSHIELIERIGKYYGFDDWIGTHYERLDSGFTGNVHVPSHAKDKALKQLLGRHRVTMKDSLGVGDTKSDIPMLNMVERPIAFNPDRELFAAAKEKGWKIVIERKNVIYELEPKDGTYHLLHSN